MPAAPGGTANSRAADHPFGSRTLGATMGSWASASLRGDVIHGFVVVRARPALLALLRILAEPRMIFESALTAEPPPRTSGHSCPRMHLSAAITKPRPLSPAKSALLLTRRVYSWCGGSPSRVPRTVRGT